MKDIQAISNMGMLDASPFGNFIVFIKQSNRCTSKLIATSMDETVTKMAPTLRKFRNNCEPQQHIKYEQSATISNLQHHLVRDGVYLKFQQLNSVLTEDITTIKSASKHFQPFLNI